MTPRNRNHVGVPKRQAATINAIRGLQEQNRMAPTLAELAEVLGVTKGTVWITLRTLARKGLIVKAFDKHRSLMLTAAASQVPHQPLSKVGRAA